MSPADVQEVVDSWELAQAQTRVQLTDEEFVRFVPKLRRLQSAKRQQVNGRRAMMADLNRLLSADPVDEAAVAAKLKALEDQAADAERAVQDAYAQLDQSLTVRQRARFLIFEQQIETRKLALLAAAQQARAQANQPPAPAPPAGQSAPARPPQ